MSKKYKCPDCNGEFNNIFEYLDMHEIDVEMFIPLSNGINIDLMSMLSDVHSLIEMEEYKDANEIITGIASALYAHAKGYLPEIMHRIDEEELIDELVEQETKDLDDKIQKLLKNREKGEW